MLVSQSQSGINFRVLKKHWKWAASAQVGGTAPTLGREAGVVLSGWLLIWKHSVVKNLLVNQSSCRSHTYCQLQTLSWNCDMRVVFLVKQVLWFSLHLGIQQGFILFPRVWFLNWMQSHDRSSNSLTMLSQSSTFSDTVFGCNHFSSKITLTNFTPQILHPKVLHAYLSHCLWYSYDFIMNKIIQFCELSTVSV